MATVTTIQEIISTKALGINCTGNGSNSIQATINYPSFDSTFDQNLLEDLLINSANGFTSNESVTITVDGVSNNYVINATGNSIWLSEILGTTRQILSNKINEIITFEFTTNKLLKFMVISANASDYIDANSTYTGISTATNYYLLCETEIQDKDSISLVALRDCIDKTKTTITGNGSNIIKIANTYPTPFGSALDKTLVIDNLITFSKLVPIGTEIYIKKDGVHVSTYTTKANIKSIWLSDMLGMSRELLYQKVDENYELTFIYDQYLNNQVVCGDLTNFVSASIASLQLSQGLFQLSNAKALDSMPTEINSCNFVVNYEDYDHSIKSAVLELNDQQSITLTFVTDNSNPENPKTLVKLSNVDNLYNAEISLVMDSTAITDLITLIRDFARRMNELNSKTV